MAILQDCLGASPSTLAALLAVLLLPLFWLFLRPRHDPREPPLFGSRIPLLADLRHLLGLTLKQTAYFEELS
jgi:hypothetical protein